MKPLRLVVLGIGSVRCAPPLIAALASYFGERDLEVRLYDEDAERLDLFDRLARRCFLIEESKHTLLAFDDAFEALEDADLVIVTLGENSARRFLKTHQVSTPRGDPIPSVAAALIDRVPEEAAILSLVPGLFMGADRSITNLDWPPEPSMEERRAIPHQVLRWIRSEESVHGLIDEHRQSQVKRWLDEHAHRRV